MSPPYFSEKKHNKTKTGSGFIEVVETADNIRRYRSRRQPPAGGWRLAAVPQADLTYVIWQRDGRHAVKLANSGDGRVLFSHSSLEEVQHG